MCEIFSKTRTSPSQAKNIATCQNSALGVSQFLQSILNIQTYIYIHTYAHIYIYTIKTQLKYTSTLRLLGRFTTCIAQTTTASRLFFALNGTSCLRNEKNLEIFDFKTFFKFCTIMMT